MAPAESLTLQFPTLQCDRRAMSLIGNLKPARSRGSMGGENLWMSRTAGFLNFSMSRNCVKKQAVFARRRATPTTATSVFTWVGRTRACTLPRVAAVHSVAVRLAKARSALKSHVWALAADATSGSKIATTIL